MPKRHRSKKEKAARREKKKQRKEKKKKKKAASSKESNPRCRRWAITWNNHSVEAHFKPAVVKYQEKIKWCIGVDEVAPETGTPHVQGAVVMKNPSRLESLQSMLPGGHFEPMEKPPIANRRYCLKKQEETQAAVYEFGDLPRPGTRTDIHKAVEDIKAGATWEELQDNHPEVLMKYPGGVKLHKQIADKRRIPHKREMPRVIVHFGRSRSGKTHDAEEFKGDSDTYTICPPYKWWDGYEGQPVIIMEEYKNQLQLQQLLGLLDRRRVRLEIKGAFTYSAWSTVFITSNVSPKYWHLKCSDEERNALKERIAEVWEYKGRNDRVQLNKDEVFARPEPSHPFVFAD